MKKLTILSLLFLCYTMSAQSVQRVFLESSTTPVAQIQETLIGNSLPLNVQSGIVHPASNVMSKLKKPSSIGLQISNRYDFTRKVYQNNSADLVLGAITTTPDSTTLAVFTNGTSDYISNHAVGAVYGFNYDGWGVNKFADHDQVTVDSIYVSGYYSIYDTLQTDSIRVTIFNGADGFNQPFSGVQYNAGTYSSLNPTAQPTLKTLHYSGSALQGRQGGPTASNARVVSYALTDQDSGYVDIAVGIPNGLTMNGDEILGVFIEYIPGGLTASDTINFQSGVSDLNTFAFYYYREANTASPKGHFIRSFDSTSTNCSNFLFSESRYAAWQGPSSWRNDMTSANASYSHLIAVHASGQSTAYLCSNMPQPYLTDRTVCEGDSITNYSYNDTIGSGISLVWYEDSLSAQGSFSIDTVMSTDTITMFLEYMSVDSCFSDRTRINFYPAPKYADTLYLQTCDSFFPYLNASINSDTTITVVFNSLRQCDSSVTYQIEYHPVKNLNINYDPNLSTAYVLSAPEDSVVWDVNQTNIQADSIILSSSGLVKTVTYNGIGCLGDTSMLHLTMAFDTAQYYIDTVSLTVMDTLVIDVSMIGINPPVFEYQVKVFPNPTTGILFIELPQAMVTQSYEMEIRNALGQSMFSAALNQQQTQVNLSAFTALGNYTLLLKDAGGSVIDSRVIILQ